MAQKTFIIGDGEITFGDDKINISDKSRRRHFVQLFHSLLWMVFSLTFVIRYLNTSDVFMLYASALIGVGHFVLFFIILFFRSTKKEISISEITHVKFKQRVGKGFLVIKLKNGATRTVSKIDDTLSELKTYFQKELGIKIM